MAIMVLVAASWLLGPEIPITVFKSLKEMNAAEKRDMKSSRYHVFRLKSEVKKAFLCQRCKGSGSQQFRVQRPGARGWAEDVQGGCATCDATGICPVDSIQDKLDDYCRRKHLYEKMYPFDAPVETGLEAWLLERVKSLRTLRRIHQSACRRMAGGSIPEGRAVLAVVEIFNIIEEGDSITYQATMWTSKSAGLGYNLMLVAPEMPEGVEEGSCILGLMFNAGKVEYENFMHKKLEAHVLTMLSGRNLGKRQMPWD